MVQVFHLFTCFCFDLWRCILSVRTLESLERKKSSQGLPAEYDQSCSYQLSSKVVAAASWLRSRARCFGCSGKTQTLQCCKKAKCVCLQGCSVALCSSSSPWAILFSFAQRAAREPSFLEADGRSPSRLCNLTNWRSAATHGGGNQSVLKMSLRWHNDSMDHKSLQVP